MFSLGKFSRNSHIHQKLWDVGNGIQFPALSSPEIICNKKTPSTVSQSTDRRCKSCNSRAVATMPTIYTLPKLQISCCHLETDISIHFNTPYRENLQKVFLYFQHRAEINGETLKFPLNSSCHCSSPEVGSSALPHIHYLSNYIERDRLGCDCALLWFFCNEHKDTHKAVTPQQTEGYCWQFMLLIRKIVSPGFWKVM